MIGSFHVFTCGNRGCQSGGGDRGGGGAEGEGGGQRSLATPPAPPRPSFKIFTLGSAMWTGTGDAEPVCATISWSGNTSTNGVCATVCVHAFHVNARECVCTLFFLCVCVFSCIVVLSYAVVVSQSVSSKSSHIQTDPRQCCLICPCCE